VDVFVSVGATATAAQEDFVRAIEERLRSEGLTPHTSGRNNWDARAPLRAVTRLMDKCSGAVVIALERAYFPTGVDKRGGSKQSELSNVVLPTPWNQMEAAMAYCRGLPLMIIVEEGLKCEGMLERYDWTLLTVRVDRSELTTAQFNGVLASWKQEVLDARAQAASPAPVQAPPADPAQMTVGELVGRLKPTHLWSVLVALGALIAGAFALGAKLVG